MAITDPTTIPARISNGYSKLQNFGASGYQAARVAFVSQSNNAVSMSEYLLSDTPSLPSGVGAFMPLEMAVTTSGGNGNALLLAEKISLGSVDLNSGVFTDGSAMPTKTIFNTTTQTVSPLIAELSTAGTGTSRTMTVTYVDQSGNAAETTASISIQNAASIYAGCTVPLNTGDWGVQDITNCVPSGTATGTVQFYGLLPIVMWTPSPAVNSGITMDLLNSGICRRIGASAKIGVYYVQTVAQTGMAGYINWLGDTT